MIYCPICKLEMKNRRAFGIHMATSHRSLELVERERVIVYAVFGSDKVLQTIDDYIAEKYCVNTLPIDITKYLTLIGIKRTSKQERATNRYKKAYLAGIQQKYGASITNISQVAEVQAKKEKTASNNHGSYVEYLAQQRITMQLGYINYAADSDRLKNTSSKVIATSIARYGVTNPAMFKETRDKIGAANKLLCSFKTEDELRAQTAAGRASVCSRGGYSSKPEKRVRKSLIELDINASCNKHLWNYNWDMIIGNILIEVQGTMWHAKPGKYKENDLIMGKLIAKDIWAKDAKKHKKAREEGYIVIEIWEDEIAKCNDIELTLLVKERLEENGYHF